MAPHPFDIQEPLQHGDSRLFPAGSFERGRTKVRARLQDGDGRVGRVIFVKGEQGVGKSTFLRWLRGELATSGAAAPVDVRSPGLNGRIIAAPGAAFNLISEAIAINILGQLQAAPPAGNPAEGALVSLFQGLDSRPPEQGPIVVTLDDLDKLADFDEANPIPATVIASVLDFFDRGQDFLKGLTQRYPVTVVVTASPSWMPRLRTVTWLDVDRNTIDLGNFGPEEIRKIIELRLNHAAPGVAQKANVGGVLALIMAASGGIPREALVQCGSIFEAARDQKVEAWSRDFLYKVPKFRARVQDLVDAFVESGSQVEAFARGYAALHHAAGVFRARGTSLFPALQLLQKGFEPCNLTTEEEKLAEQLGAIAIDEMPANRGVREWRTSTEVRHVLGQWMTGDRDLLMLDEYFRVLQPHMPATHGFLCEKHGTARTHAVLDLNSGFFRCGAEGPGGTCTRRVAMPTLTFVFDTCAIFDGIPAKMARVLNGACVIVPRPVQGEMANKEKGTESDRANFEIAKGQIAFLTELAERPNSSLTLRTAGERHATWQYMVDKGLADAQSIDIAHEERAIFVTQDKRARLEGREEGVLVATYRGQPAEIPLKVAKNPVGVCFVGILQKPIAEDKDPIVRLTADQVSEYLEGAKRSVMVFVPEGVPRNDPPYEKPALVEIRWVNQRDPTKWSGKYRGPPDQQNIPPPA